MTPAHCLVVAKAPVPGEAKTRLAAGLDPEAAARLAAAALLDTLDACDEAFPGGRRHLALTGDLDRAHRGAEIRARLAGWRVFDQCGHDFAARLAHAHAQVAAPVVQIGTDTPQLTGHQLHAAAAALADHDAVLGPAEDGGWWLLALRDPQHAAVLRGVPTSTAETGARTLSALRDRGLAVAETVTLRDVDEVTDADAVAAAAPASRFAAAWATIDRPFATVYTSALQGSGCHVEWLDDDLTPLPMPQWRRTADRSDRELLDHCVGDTLDVGCGPGRMAEHLARRGHRVLGVDIVPEAAAQASRRGLPTWVGDVFGPVPDEGAWHTALLADGNIGIGGDPQALLCRMRQLVSCGGRVVADLRPPGDGVRHRWARIRTDRHTSRPFRWSLVSADAVAPLARTAGFPVTELHEHGGRWFGVLRDRP